MHSWLDKIAAVRVLVIGDVMLDRYYFADVTRISPEGPVPVAHVKETKNTLGGAANVAHNLARLGCRVTIAGISGAAVQLGTVQLKGMALATVVGMLLSLAFHLLDRLGLTNEPIEP